MRSSTLVLTLVIVPSLGCAASGVEQLGWLAGCWASDGADPGSGEQWMAPAGGTLLGMARQVRGRRTVSHEWLRIEGTGGKLTYVARPAGQDEARFEAAVATGQSVVFENPSHDFAQRIAYELSGDALHARIDGTDGTGQHAAEFPMHRVPCPGN